MGGYQHFNESHIGLSDDLLGLVIIILHFFIALYILNKVKDMCLFLESTYHDTYNFVIFFDQYDVMFSGAYQK